MRQRAVLVFGWGVVGAMWISTSVASAAVVGYWRAETDDNAGAGLSVANEIVGGTPLTAGAASIAGQVPVSPLPQTGAVNAGSINGDANINASAAHYAALNTGSITVEFWARTEEGAGYLMARSTGTTATEGGIPASLSDGFAIENFNNVQARFVTDDGGTGTQLSLVPTSAINLGSTWVHLALTYDATSGVGKLYADGVERASVAGTPGQPMKWGTNLSLFVGGGMDGGGLSSSAAVGLIDEIRISDVALAPSQFLNAVPEPGTVAAAGIGMLELLRRPLRRK